MKWQVRRSRYVLEDRWIRVRADDCVTPRGTEISPFYVLEYRDFAQVVATDEEDRVVLVRLYRHGRGEVSLELPGGIMNPGETNPVAAGLRELQEETGYTGGTARKLLTLAPNPANFSNGLHLIRVEGATAGPRQIDEAEETEVVLLSREDALAAARSGGMLNAQHVGLLFLALTASAPLSRSEAVEAAAPADPEPGQPRPD